MANKSSYAYYGLVGDIQAFMGDLNNAIPPVPQLFTVSVVSVLGQIPTLSTTNVIVIVVAGNDLQRAAIVDVVARYPQLIQLAANGFF